MLEKPGFTFYWDAKAGKIWLEIDKWNSEFLYVESLPAASARTTSDSIAAQLGNSAIVRFDRSDHACCSSRRITVFARTAITQMNGSVKDAFAESTLWGLKSQRGRRTRVVDATNFYLRDVHEVTTTLQRGQQGTYRLDTSRSAFYLPNTKNFLQNTEVKRRHVHWRRHRGFVQQVVGRPNRSPCASVTRSFNRRRQVTSRACSIPAPVISALITWTLPRRSKSR